MNDRHEYTLAEYAAMDSKNLTLQDALDDAAFQHKHSQDKKRLFAFSPEMLRTVTELETAEDIQRFTEAINAYFNNGEDVLHSGRLDGMSAFTRSTIRQAIEAHNSRIEADVISKYRAFVTGKQGAYKRYMESAGTPAEDSF